MWPRRKVPASARSLWNTNVKAGAPGPAHSRVPSGTTTQKDVAARAPRADTTCCSESVIGSSARPGRPVTFEP